MKRWIAPVAGMMIAGAVAVPAFAQTQPTTPAQPQTPTTAGVRGGRAGLAGLLICSTSNPTDAVAQALSMSASDLRVALVSGKTLSQIADSKSVDMQTIREAVATQRKADLDQALKDGLLTQDQYDAITKAMDNAVQANAQIGIRIPEHNVVNREQAAADALGMSCADLVKAQQSGQSIAEIAQGKSVEVQTVIDAVTKAYSDASAEDVKEGLISQAESDGQLSRLTIEIGQWVYDTRGGFGFGGLGDFGGPGGFGGQGGRPGNGQNGQGGQGGPFGQRGGQGGRPGNGNGGPNGMNPPNGFGQPGTQNSPDATPTVVPNT